MKVFLRAVVTGFGYSLGATLFKRVSKRLGLDEDTPKVDKPVDDDGEVSVDDDTEDAELLPSHS